jgi:hypothetical protein
VSELGSQTLQGEGIKLNHELFFAGITVSLSAARYRQGVHADCARRASAPYCRTFAGTQPEHAVRHFPCGKPHAQPLAAQQVLDRLLQEFIRFSSAEQGFMLVLAEFPDDRFEIHLQAGSWPDTLPPLETVAHEPNP